MSQEKSILNTEAGDAKKSADKAADAADRANKSAQQANSEAERAKNRAQELERESLLLQQQLLAQASRPSLLYGKRSERLIEQLKPFAGQKAEVRICHVYLANDEAMHLAMHLQFILSKDANWSVNHLATESCFGTGIQVSVNPKAPDPVRKAADALWLALHGVPLTMVGDKPFVMESPRGCVPISVEK